MTGMEYLQAPGGASKRIPGKCVQLLGHTMKNEDVKPVIESDITLAAISVGIRPADTVFLHSSLSSMIDVRGGAKAVINGFLSAAGGRGTLAAPSNWWKGGRNIE